MQLIARDEPKIKPNPLATLQDNVPVITPGACACAGAKTANALPSAATKAAARRILLDIRNPPRLT